MININDRVWLYDNDLNNHDENGKYIGRGRWECHIISGETKQSWLVSNGSKIDKKDLTKTRKRDSYGYCGIMKALYSQQDVDDDIWRSKNRPRIADEILILDDASKLRKIAEIIGYKN